MILVTGGAGFIGSNIVRALNSRGIDDIIIVDHLGSSEKWKNLNGLKFYDYIEKHLFYPKLIEDLFGIKRMTIKTIFHMGACSDTVEDDASYLVNNNYRDTINLYRSALNCYARFIYASSGATYGKDSILAEDNEQNLIKLKPLNMYGFSKHMVDLYIKNDGMKAVGLKYFNVFGPGESHKENMASYVYQSFNKIQENGYINIFSPDGTEGRSREYFRDFIYIKDAVNMTLFFYDNPKLEGIYNIGSGIHSTWNEVAEYTFESLGVTPEINYTKLPLNLQKQYQVGTWASITKLRRAGYKDEITSLKEAVKEYIEYLNKE